MTKPINSTALLLAATVACTLACGTATAQEAKDTDASGNEQPTLAAARDALELDSTDVTGNRELPRVMVIVPWKRSAPGELAGRPLNSLMDEVLTPIDREVFVRRLKFYDGLRTASDTQAKNQKP